MSYHGKSDKHRNKGRFIKDTLIITARGETFEEKSRRPRSNRNGWAMACPASTGASVV